jgi:hypothetical protein
MKRGGLFFIGLISAIITIISLNVALGRSGYYYERYPFYNRYHHCNSRYDNRYRDDENNHDERQQRTDSTNSNY